MSVSLAIEWSPPMVSAAKFERPSAVGAAYDDAELVARARAGEASAVDALFRRHAASVLGVVTRLVGRSHDAEDIAQEALATALDELDALRDPGAFRGWLMQIAVRQTHRYFRRRKLRRIFGLDRGADDATLESLASTEASAETRAELALIDMALGHVDAPSRIAWSLRVIEGESLDAVAKLCGCSLATAKRRIASARATLAARGVEAGADA